MILKAKKDEEEEGERQSLEYDVDMNKDVAVNAYRRLLLCRMP